MTPAAPPPAAMQTFVDFAPRVGQAFTLWTPDATLALRLDAAEPFGDGGGDSFRLLFVAPGGERLEQGTYPVEQGGAEGLLFLVPVGPQPAGLPGYEAVFNRQTPRS